MSGLVANEPVGVAAVILAALKIVWVAFPRIPVELTAAIDTFFIVLTAWYARRNSTPNVKVETMKKGA